MGGWSAGCGWGRRGLLLCVWVVGWAGGVWCACVGVACLVFGVCVCRHVRRLRRAEQFVCVLCVVCCVLVVVRVGGVVCAAIRELYVYRGVCVSN